ncbi:MAG TPA: hypothetical protein PKE00_10280, partial [Planctomycetota bacterium]|nr:hypothetical protein [Planctomycetota bacterium]
MSISESALRARLAALTARDQKIVLGLFAVFIRQPQQVRDREWVAEQLAHLTLLAGDFEADTALDGVESVRSYLAQRGSDLVERASVSAGVRRRLQRGRHGRRRGPRFPDCVLGSAGRRSRWRW